MNDEQSLAKAINLPGYTLNDGRITSEGRAVFSATRNTDLAAVLIYTLYAQYPSVRQIAEIKREAAITQRLQNIDGVIRVFAVENYGNGNLAIITEPFEQSLADMLKNTASSDKQPTVNLSRQRTVSLALELVHILDKMHQQGVVHKALTPEHVLVKDSTDRICLSGFGIASELSQEHQAVLCERLEGPLPYISPEQTGRIKRDLDYRSDYYSLGVVLFEMLTGQRPFEADNVLGWVHQHISRTPPKPSELDPSVPEALSQIVLKLLAKSPDERYQSANGLLADLHGAPKY